MALAPGGRGWTAAAARRPRRRTRVGQHAVGGVSMLTLPPVSAAMVWANENRSPSTSPASASAVPRAALTTLRANDSSCSQRTSERTSNRATPASAAACRSGSASLTATAVAHACRRPARGRRRPCRGPRSPAPGRRGGSRGVIGVEITTSRTSASKPSGAVSTSTNGSPRASSSCWMLEPLITDSWFVCSHNRALSILVVRTTRRRPAVHSLIPSTTSPKECQWMP